MTTPVGRAILASQAARANSTKIDSFPADIGPHGLLMIFNEYRFEASTTRALLSLPEQSTNIVQSPKGAILLPIPNTLIDRNSMRITQTDMADTYFYEGAARSAAAGKAAFETGGIAVDVTQKIGDLWSSIKNASPSDILGGLRKTFGGNFNLNAISQGVGETLNPKSSLMFNGIDLKSFSFDWVLAPSEPAESDAIAKIIQKLKENSLPSYYTNSALTRAMLNYPSTVDMYLLGVDTNYFMKFKTSMISDVTFSYTPNGVSILRGGKPAAVNLSISLREMDIHTANDYGYDPTTTNIWGSIVDAYSDVPLY